ncbi:MAG: S8 family peptidase [Elusimicrobia bacterium]|nr:S8 family peptidase [Elusimicrobiota bacterium]
MISSRLSRVLALLAVLAAGTPSFSAQGPAKESPRDKTHRIIVKLRDGAESKVRVMSAERVSKLSARAAEKLEFVRAMSGSAHVMRMSRRMGRREAEDVARRLMKDPAVEYAEPDLKAFPLLVPNDASYAGSQWHYFAPASEVAGANLPAAWDVTTGASSLVIAVIDSGVVAHADFDAPVPPAGRMVQGYDFISPDDPGKYYVANDGDGRDNDPRDPGNWITAGEDAGTEAEGYLEGCGARNSSWHGTHVTGTIAANSNNAVWGAGVNWVSKIQPIRVIGKCGGYTSDIADAVRWAAGWSVGGSPDNATPAKVINMSIGGTGACSFALQSAIDAAVSVGAVVVTAAGNDTDAAANSFPGNCSNVVNVAAINRAGNLASYSNFGPEVTLAAPGGDIPTDVGVYSLGNAGTAGPSASPAGDRGVFKDGTSMAAPHVSGVVSLMLSYNPNLTPAQVKSDLQACVRSFPAGSTCDTGICGAGMLDARGALRPGAPVGFSGSASGATSITWTWTAVPNATYDVFIASDPAKYLGNTAVASFTRSDLTANVYTGVIVKATNTVCSGGPVLAPSTATYAPASAITAVQVYVSSVQADFTTLAQGTLTGYRVDASTASDFTGTIFSSASYDFGENRLTVAGLASLTSYYLRIAVLNQLGAQTLSVYGSQVYTLTSLSPPALTGYGDLGSRQLRIGWNAAGNPGGLLYTVQASSAQDFSGVVSSAAGTDLTSNLFTGLLVNTSYYFRIWAQGGPVLGAGPTATYALSPSTATPLFSGVGGQDLTVSWTAGGNPPGTLYEAQLSRAADFFTLPVVSSFTRNVSASFGSLSSNSLYNARVRAVSHGGQPFPLSYRSLSSTATLASPVAPTAPYFQAVSSASLVALFDSGPNPAGTGYVAQLSTSADFVPVHAQVMGVMTAGANTAAFTGLESNRRLYLQTAALNVTQTPTAFTPAAQSTATFAAPPAASAAAAVHFTSITFAWGTGGNRTGTTYDVLMDDDPGFGSPDASQTTGLSSATVSLSSNTAYYARVRARSLEAGNPHSSYVDLGPVSTLPEPPTADPAGAFVSVTFTSATLRWQARPLAPPTATCAGYRIQLSSAQGFTGTVHSADVSGAASTGGSVAGLTHSTTYYLRVGSLNADGSAAYTLMGSTRTPVPQISSGTILGSTELRVVPPYPQVRLITATIPAKTFSVGTPVELNTSVETALPPIEGQPDLEFLGPGVGFSLSAGGRQPNNAFPLTIQYDLPVGVDTDLLSLARYDDTSHKWLLLRSSVDRGQRTLTGIVDHFSFFAPVIALPGNDLAAVEIYPIPWEPSSGDSLQGAGALTFTRLPASARVRIHTILGELVDEGTASASGVLHWDGRNTRGHRVGTGTYLAVIESGGAKVLRRIAIIR